MLTVSSPRSMGLDPGRWQSALNLADDWCQQDRIPAIGLIVGRAGLTTGAHYFGRQTIDHAVPAVDDNSLFLVASITKPVVATAVLILCERGQLGLDDRVVDFLPEFASGGKPSVTVRHLLAHTSGLPDMLPNNQRLRQTHAPLSAFVEDTCLVEPDFPAGHRVQYQSMGFAILSELIQRVSRQSYANFLHEELFAPLEMHDTVLGAPDDWFPEPEPRAAQIAEVRLSDDQQNTDWNWNSRFWRSFGAPWGGLLTTPTDLAHFAQMMLNRGTWGDRQILSPATVEAATSNQLLLLPDISDRDRVRQPWGLGWRLHRPTQTAYFGDLLGPRSYGHWGATGTVLWIDPDRDAFAVILTTQPQEPDGALLAELSNAIAASLPGVDS